MPAITLTKAVSPEFLAQYNGTRQGDDPDGILDIEFKSSIDAAMWAIATDCADIIKWRNAFPEDNGKYLSARVVVQIRIRHAF